MSGIAGFERDAVALVVGGSGGIGAAFLRRFAADPAFVTVIGTARDPARVEHADLALALDLENDDAIETCAETLRAKVDRLDVVIYCAGLLQDLGRGVQPEKRLADLDRRALEAAFAVNAFGPVLLARALAPLLPRRDRCLWMNLSARVGSIGDNRLGGWYAYRASKAAQNMLTRTLAIELGRRHRGLVCAALHPGTVSTALSAPFRGQDDRGVMTPDASVDHLLQVMAGLDATDSGSFHGWDGREIPW